MKKNNIFLVFMGVVLFVSAYILPTLFLVAFNFTKGIMLNEDGIVLIPLGIGLILLTVGLDAMLIWKALKNFRGRKYGRVIVLVSAVLAVLAGTALSGHAWWLFFEALTFFKGMNTGLQR